MFSQLILLPEDTGEFAPTVTLNEYYKKYPEVPKAPQLSVSWYRSPEDIGSKIELHNIAHNTRYFEDDGTSYLEKIIDGKKARLFLKETTGFRYTIYDLVYVFYLDNTEGIVNDDINSRLPESIIEPNNDLDNDLGKDKTTNDANDEIDLDDGNDDGNETGSTVSDDLKNTIVPFYSLKETGKSIFVDIVLQEKNNVSKREVLYRYGRDENKVYTETYTYTEKGAIQRLNRNFSDGTLQRYIYYFSTGGLKDVYYQDPDGSTYLLTYTLAGSLSEKTLYNTEQFLSYELKNTYDENNQLIFQQVMDYDAMRSREIVFENKHIIEQRYYELIEKEDETDEEANEESSENSSEETDNANSDSITITKKIIGDKQLLKTEYYTYNNTGEQIRKQQQDILHENIVSVIEEDGMHIETNKKDGVIINQTITKDTNKTITYFFQEAEILRQYFENNNKIKEEIINNGEVIETREY